MKLPTAHLKPHGKVITPLHVGAVGTCLVLNSFYWGLFLSIGVPIIPVTGLGIAMFAGSVMSAQEFIKTHTHSEE